jgi:hypothetical protein
MTAVVKLLFQAIGMWRGEFRSFKEAMKDGFDIEWNDDDLDYDDDTLASDPPTWT